MLATGRMRVEHHDRFPILVTNGINGTHLIGVARHKHKTVCPIIRGIHNGSYGKIHIRPLFFHLVDLNKTVFNNITGCTLVRDIRSSHLLLRVKALNNPNSRTCRNRLNIGVLAFACCKVNWMSLDWGGEIHNFY